MKNKLQDNPMTDALKNTNHKPTANGHIQDKLVKDSIAHSKSISSQAQARQNSTHKVLTDSSVKNSTVTVDNNNSDFTQVQDLPTGTPQGQQTTIYYAK